MISCREFIPAYSELFKYLHEKSGYGAVQDFWAALSDSFLGNLRDLVSTKGLAGCFEYWSHTLPEEAADFRMTLDEDNEVLEIEMRRCPSKGRLIETQHIEPYEFYCEHCEALYKRVLEPFGFDYLADLSQCDKAKCRIIIKPSAHRR